MKILKFLFLLCVLSLFAACSDPCEDLVQEACLVNGTDSQICKSLTADSSRKVPRQEQCVRAHVLYQSLPANNE